MRTVMYIGSLAMVAAGIFCLANGSATFLSLAFIIGIIFTAMGVIQFIIGRRSSFDILGKGVSLAADGAIMFVFGLVILSGQVTDDITAQMLFALWLTIEAVLSAGGLSFGSNDRNSNANLVLSAAMLLLGVYTFFNTRLLNINAIALIGAAMMILGLRRFRLSFSIEYNKTGFLSGNEERLEEAQAEEKKALAKAKEGIREQKIAQRKIEKIKSDMEQESITLNDVESRRRNKEKK